MMALPGHSPPPPFRGAAGSPPRTMNGFSDSPATFPIYGPQTRPMPPPSPQHFAPRFPQTPANHASTIPILNPFESRAPIPPYKRPGSSMTISSMLGSEPEKPQDPFYNPRAPPRQPTHGPSMSLGAVMSPPQYPPRLTDYNYKPRSQTPDKLTNPSPTRPYRSSSGSLMQRPASLYDPPPHETRAQPVRHGDPVHSSGLAQMGTRDEAAERARRTSISGLLQRPESEPQHPPTNGSTMLNGGPFGRPVSTNSDGYGMSKPVADRATVLPGSYDTRPPPFANPMNQLGVAPTSTPKNTTNPQERRDAQSLSPEFRRAQPVPNEHRSLASILNSENPYASQSMMRQDSVQSQSDRSAFGDRYRPRAFSPFAGSVASQTMSVTSMPADDQARKGSDEMSQHRQILGLAAEAKRGRFSPVPQAVQGAQAQTPVPDAGVKNEHGRVFAGLGGGLGTSSGPNSTRPSLAASPFKSNEGAARLSEENLMKISRSSSGVPKRARKYDDELRAESDAGLGKKTVRGAKRSKYALNYHLDLDDAPRRSTPLSTVNSARKGVSPTTATSHPQPLQHHHHTQKQVNDQGPLFKPKKTIRISSIITSAKRLPRRHIGNFKYDPEIDNADIARPSSTKFDVSIKPNLLPSFTDNDKVNCTYTVRVPKLWLQERERRLIGRESYLWGSGVYTDDSDVVAAAMHSGFMKSVPPDSVDQVLLDRVVKEQNAKIEGLVNPPEKPVEPEASKDAVITLLVLPTLDRYAGSSRFGICSRTWPENATKTQHDGVSFAVLKVEFVSGGVEARRMGRTGVSKRARLKLDLEARKQGEILRKEMIEKAKLRGRLKRNVTKHSGPTSAPARPGTVTGTMRVFQKSVLNPAKNTPLPPPPPLDVGKEPGEWLRQLDSAGG